MGVADGSRVGGYEQMQKWSKGKQKEKVVNQVLFDQANYDKLLSEVPKYKLITASVLSDRLRVSIFIISYLASNKIKEQGQHTRSKFTYAKGRNIIYWNECTGYTSSIVCSDPYWSPAWTYSVAL